MLKNQFIKPLLFFLLISSLFVIIYLSLFSLKGKTEINLVFRYDDFRNTSSYNVEKEILALIERYHATCSFGVIPFEGNISDNTPYKTYILDSVKTRSILKYVKNGEIEICLHGFSHQSKTKSPFESEFKYLSYSEQFNKIMLGKQNLDSVFRTDIITFIPPWNSFDSVTLRVLSDLKFQNISSDGFGESLKDLKLNYIPFTTDITGIDKIVQVKRLPYNNRSNLIILMVHDYDFKEVNAAISITNIEKFRTLFSQVVDNKWPIISLKQAANLGNVFNDSQYSFNAFKFRMLEHLMFITTVIPGFQKIELLKYFYLSKYQIIKLFILVLLHYVFILFLIHFLVKWVTPQFHASFIHSLGFKLLLFLGLVVALTLMWIDDKAIGTYEAVLVVSMIGIITGIMKKTSAAITKH